MTFNLLFVLYHLPIRFNSLAFTEPRQWGDRVHSSKQETPAPFQVACLHRDLETSFSGSYYYADGNH